MPLPMADRELAQAQWAASAVRLSGYPKVCSARHLVILWQNQRDRQMKRSFARLTAVGLLAATLYSTARGQESRGQQLVADAARRLDSETSIAAELRYRAQAFGHQVLGTGSYLQSGSGVARQLRLELRMQVGEKPATLQEIRGPEDYWMRRDVPPSEPTLRRVDLLQLRRALRGDQPTGEEVLPRGAWIMLGGLPRLLATLEQSFDFAAPRAEEVQLSAGGGQPSQLPIWIVEGYWKPARLAALTGGSQSTSNLPEQMPDRVEIVLDRSDKILPLFPYRISYWRTPPKKKSERTAPPALELLTLEMFNVRRAGAIDAREFEYNPGDQEVLDLTTAYIQHLGGGKKPR